ncbi:MAG: CarboxypepD reg-like domain [Thermoplasmata archaeon]|jgi:hypothetical protein|nr:CarboxypepD reg-like domain [Thermoplasmata archaeon]
MRLLVAALLVLAALAGCASSEDRDPGNVPLPSGTGGVLVNVVQGNGDQAPIEGVTIMVKAANLVATTDSQGKVVFRGLEPGNFTAVAYKDGYEGEPETFLVSAGAYVEVVFFLDKLR